MKHNSTQFGWTTVPIAIKELTRMKSKNTKTNPSKMWKTTNVVLGKQLRVHQC